MTRLLKDQSHIVVVDSHPNDYCDLQNLAGEYGWHVHFLTSALAAVRFAKSGRTDLWMIGVHLADMSGFELYETIRGQLLGSPVFMVTDHYDLTEEAKACSCGATLYLSKSPTGVLQCEPLLDTLIDKAQRFAGSNPSLVNRRRTSSFP